MRHIELPSRKFVYAVLLAGLIIVAAGLPLSSRDPTLAQFIVVHQFDQVVVQMANNR